MAFIFITAESVNNYKPGWKVAPFNVVVAVDPSITVAVVAALKALVNYGVDTILGSSAVSPLVNEITGRAVVSETK